MTRTRVLFSVAGGATSVTCIPEVFGALAARGESPTGTSEAAFSTAPSGVKLPEADFCHGLLGHAKADLTPGGLADYTDEHYRSWPTKLDPKDVETGGALKTLTMREFLAVKIAARGNYYWHKGQRPEAQVSYALAHQLYPANRAIYETLAGQVLEEAATYPWSSLAGFVRRQSAGAAVRPATRPSGGAS